MLTASYFQQLLPTLTTDVVQYISPRSCIHKGVGGTVLVADLAAHSHGGAPTLALLHFMRSPERNAPNFGATEFRWVSTIHKVS